MSSHGHSMSFLLHRSISNRIVGSWKRVQISRPIQSVERELERSKPNSSKKHVQSQNQPFKRDYEQHQKSSLAPVTGEHQSFWHELLSSRVAHGRCTNTIIETSQNRLLLNFSHSRFGIPGSSALVALEFCKGCASFSFRFSLEVSRVCQTGSETRLAFEDKIFSISETCQAREWYDMEGPDRATGGNAEIFLLSLGEPQPRKLHHLACAPKPSIPPIHCVPFELNSKFEMLAFIQRVLTLYCSSFIYSAG